MANEENPDGDRASWTIKSVSVEIRTNQWKPGLRLPTGKPSSKTGNPSTMAPDQVLLAIGVIAVVVLVSVIGFAVWLAQN